MRLDIGPVRGKMRPVLPDHKANDSELGDKVNRIGMILSSSVQRNLLYPIQYVRRITNLTIIMRMPKAVPTPNQNNKG